MKTPLDSRIRLPVFNKFVLEKKSVMRYLWRRGGMVVSELNCPCSGRCVFAIVQDILLSNCLFQFNTEVNLAMDLHPIQGGIKIFAVALCRVTRK